VVCHSCRAEAQKFGFFTGTNRERIQRYRCKQCRKTFGDIPERPLESMYTSLEDAARVVHLLCEGVGVRACERLTGLNRNTVLRIIEIVGAKCARLLDQKIQWLQVRHVQIDELWAYVFCKQRNSQGDKERGDQYTYLALDTDTKLIIAYMIGKRDRVTAGAFMDDLRKRLTSHRPQISTDGFAAYCGHLGAVFQAFKLDVNYGSITKLYQSPPLQGSSRYSPAVCTGARREVQIGSVELADICTSHVERQNLNMRLFNRRMTRLTLGYSKKLRNLRCAVAIQIAFHNFCRVHSAHKKTPAHAAGLTDRQWTIEELLKA
jgi:transposase-like protein/IS1 family transposase